MARRSSHNRKRRRNRGRFGPLFKLLCLAALVVALTAGATVFFRVETVVVTGNQRYSQEEIVAATGIQVGDNLYALNKFKIDQQLRQTLPYIGELTIRRALPSTIIINVAEWEAVARIAVPDAAQAAAARQELEGEKPQGGEGGDDSRQEPVTTAQEPWLISVKGKLLEPAPADSTAILVSGITPLAPRAGVPLTVPPSEEPRLNALVALLGALEEAEMLPQVSEIRLDSTAVYMNYLGRFDVKLPLNGDFRYKLQVLKKVVEEEITPKHGPDASGTADMTQEKYDLVFSSR